MTTIADLDKEIYKLKERNKRVELDKRWETSSTRRGLLVNAIVPSLGFLLSTLTLPYFKNLWIKFNQKKEKQV